MTITTRSRRVSVFGAASTPSGVGPGAYAPEKLGTSFKSEQRQQHSGFAASDQRNLNANKTTTAITPGPGAYITTATDGGSPVVMSNAFATKISRFAPSAPGSTIYRASSIQDNPGPGAYTVEPTSPPPQSFNQSEAAKASRAAMALLAKPSVPTIPRREQSYGYVKDPIHGDLRLQAQPSHIYTGVGQDTVGPAAYSSHSTTIWNDKKNVAPSIKSTAKRDVWGEYDTPWRAVPGPGQYDPVGTHRIRGGKRHSDRPSAVFASRVPILHDVKRADHYDEERELELLAKEQRVQHNQRPRNGKSKVEAFGSTTQRTDIASQLDAPFSTPTSKATPGPGKYAEHVASNFASFQGTSLRRASHKARGAAYRDDQHIGFASASQRHCLARAKPSSSPGPGAYKSETPRTVSKDVKAKQTVGRFGVFGSTSERQVWEQLSNMEPEDVTPGPGAYEQPVESTAGHFPMLANSAAFKSASSRFARLGASPHVHCVGDTTAPAVGEYNLRFPGADGADSGGVYTTTGHPSPTSPLHSARAPFMSTAERSVFDLKEARHAPGPGQYMDPSQDQEPAQELTRSRAVRATLGNEERFRVRPRVPARVGPGAYAIPGTVGTKSFNVTMKPAASMR